MRDQFLKKHKYEIITIVATVLLVVIYFYQNCFSIDSNFLVFFATFLLGIIAYIQLDKLNNQNEAQIIFHLEEEWNTKMTENRQEAAELFMKCFKNEKYVKEAKESEWIEIQNSFEKILDFYEKIGYFVKNRSLSVSIVYNLYSYYIQGYWELTVKSGFIKRDREDHGGGNDFYIRTKELYDAMLKQGDLKEFTQDELKKFFEEEVTTKKAGVKLKQGVNVHRDNLK